MSNDVVAQILMLVTRTDAKGQAVYVNAEIRHVIPLVILEVGMDLTTLPEKVRTILDEAALAAGIKPGMTGDDIVGAFKAWYAKFPPNPQLIADITKVLRDNAVKGLEQTGAMAAVLGTEKITGVLGGGERPKGTVPGGLAAQLAMRSAPKKKP